MIRNVAVAQRDRCRRRRRQGLGRQRRHSRQHIEALEEADGPPRRPAPRLDEGPPRLGLSAYLAELVELEKRCRRQLDWPCASAWRALDIDDLAPWRRKTTRHNWSTLVSPTLWGDGLYFFFAPSDQATTYKP